jgi:pimeloyl-ACP methyl ester carboxylesterase
VTTNDVILAEGPWEHRTVYAHGARFHVAVQGEGPLVLFVHGFPTFWWLWRKFLGPVSELGFTAAAMDMRGYGTTDHPPRGYDPRTLAADVTGVVRALGFETAIVVGHGVGGLIAWTAATLQAQAIQGIVSIAAAHPNALRAAMISNSAQTRALSYALSFQRPWLAERSLQKNHAHEIGELLNGWMTPEVLPAEVVQKYRDAFMLGNTAHCAIEFHRWAMRSIPRPDGRRFAVDMQGGVSVPVLQIHGKNDTSILVETAMDSAQWINGAWSPVTLDAGHLLPEECPDEVIDALTSWLTTNFADK